MVAPTTQKRLAEFAAHFQVEGHDDVFVLSSTDRPIVITENHFKDQRISTEESPLFNAFLAVVATSAAILALHLIVRHYLEGKKGNIDRGELGEDEQNVDEDRRKRQTTSLPGEQEVSLSERRPATKPNDDPPRLISEPSTFEQQNLAVYQIRRNNQNEETTLLREQACVIGSPSRPLKARVQEIVEISKGVDGLSASKALDVAVRLAQIESNENIKLTELAIHQMTNVQRADQKERHHRESLEEQGKDRSWRRRLDSSFRRTFGELLSSTSTLAFFLTSSTVMDYFAAVWNELKTDPLAYTTGLVCESALVETTESQSSGRMWFVGTWVYDYMQATKTDLICGFSIAQYLTTFVVIIGIHSFLPGIVGKGIQHVCFGAVLVKLSLRLMELEEVLRGALVVVLYFLLFGGGVLCYFLQTKSNIGRLKRLPSVMEVDAVDETLYQARLGFIICKILACAMLVGRVARLVWIKSLTT